MALKAILGRHDYRILEAGSGPEALRRLLEEEFAVLLIDVMMPDMGGFELAEVVRSRTRTAAVPIVFVTGHATDLDLVFRGYRAGAVDYLVKPLDPEIVRAKVAVFAELYRQRKLVEASLREKEVLLREIHHRVKNNLQIVSSLLNLQGDRQVPQIRELFLEAGTRIRSIALVHENLYQQTGTVASIDVDKYLRALLSGLMQTYASSAVALQVEEHGTRFAMDTAIPCGLIVNELVSNALKHGFPSGRAGTVIVSVHELTTRDYVLEVRDDGIGLPDDIRVNGRYSSMGLQLVTTLVSQLHGMLAIERTDGTRFRIQFPK